MCLCTTQKVVYELMSLSKGCHTRCIILQFAVFLRWIHVASSGSTSFIFQGHMAGPCVNKLQFICPFPTEGQAACPPLFSYCKHCCHQQLSLCFSGLCEISPGWAPRCRMAPLFPALLGPVRLLRGISRSHQLSMEVFVSPC